MTAGDTSARLAAALSTPIDIQQGKKGTLVAVRHRSRWQSKKPRAAMCKR